MFHGPNGRLKIPRSSPQSPHVFAAWHKIPEAQKSPVGPRLASTIARIPCQLHMSELFGKKFKG